MSKVESGCLRNLVRAVSEVRQIELRTNIARHATKVTLNWIAPVAMAGRRADGGARRVYSRTLDLSRVNQLTQSASHATGIPNGGVAVVEIIPGILVCHDANLVPFRCLQLRKSLENTGRVQMRMRIDQAGHQCAPTAVDDLRVR